MFPSRNVSMALLSLCALVSGCAEPGEPGEVPFDRVSVPSTALEFPVSANGLSPVTFWAPENQSALRSLGAAALLGPTGTLTPTSLLNSEGGRSVLSYAFRCALGDSATVQSAAGHAFTGDLALAPAWTSRALTTSEQRWLTACLLDHLNGLQASVPILMKGGHPALVADPDDDPSGYTINDMTAFGNIFLASPKAYVCVDPGISLACGVGFSTYTLQRICGLSLTCGATHLGVCSLNCTYNAAGNPTCSVLFGSTYAETISTKLEENGGLSLYPLCDLL
jgi:hypothetical protein